MTGELALSLKTTKAIFCHIPKTAGTSIFWEIDAATRNVANFHTWKGHVTGLARKERLTEIMGYDQGCILWKNAFTFTFIRNPWDRLVSVYHFISKLTPDSIESFDQWVHEGLPITDHARQLFRGDDKRTFLDQEAWFCDIDGTELVEFVGRFERVQQDWQTVCKKLHIAPSILRHVNQGNHKPYKQHYTLETKKIVAGRFGDFIERYKYQF